MMKRWMALAAGTLVPFTTLAQENSPGYLGEMVVTAPAMSDPITVETDPKAPRQPVPAGDGAAFLKNIPGFSSVRKGGTSGDPVFRGLGGSRLNILQDGAYVFGGCGGRMDPPTAYTYPESFDKVTVLKGPQSVLYGGGNVAGTVLFERVTPRFEEAGTRFMAGGMVGSFGRNDQIVDATAGAAPGFMRIIGTRLASDDYEDGDGNKVHSEYERWSGTAIVGWTPDEDTRIELNVDRSDGEAAYADRTMDGVVFDREAWGVKASRDNLSPLVQRIEAQYYHSYVDHVMDNFSLRTPPAPPMMKMVSNPDRTTDGARLVVDLAVGDRTGLIVGTDYRDDEHTKRGATTTPRMADMSFEQRGIFAQLEHAVGERDLFAAGLRMDKTTAKADAAVGGVAAGTEDDDTTRGAFVRYEHALSDSWRVLAGVGRAERAPDYWERVRTFDIDTEKSTQFDLGAAFRSGQLDATVSAFYTRVDDFILIDHSLNPSAKPAGAAKNVDATLYGFEADAAYAIAPNWTARATLAHVIGENDTDDVALAQVPPLEGTVSLGYDDKTWAATLLVRAAAEQDRVDVDRGGIAGADVGETDSFTVVSFNAGYRANENLKITAGVDNLFDETYAEHLSRAGAQVAGYGKPERVNEPGRLWWMKATLSF
ncbi:MAG: TonB-dependent copper receptor [Gammaproteobacteria bacterium]|nr:TonB-dependent copper receptor [Gammaproteobacteria bacterium]